MLVPVHSRVNHLHIVLEIPEPTVFMCTEHTARCPVCRKEYLIFVEFCNRFHPPLVACPDGKNTELEEMPDGFCPSPVCPNSISGGCAVI
jgi:hypothetical protein